MTTDRVTQVVSASAAIRALEAVIATFRRAAASSSAMARVHAATANWRLLPNRERASAVGVMLCTAAGVHLTWSWWQGHPPGWLWLVLPGLVGLVGVLFLLAPATIRESR